MALTVGPPWYVSGIVAPGVVAGQLCWAKSGYDVARNASVAASAARRRERCVTGGLGVCGRTEMDGCNGAMNHTREPRVMFTGALTDCPRAPKN